MRELTIIVRILLGALFIVTGLNGFFHFLPTPAMIGREQEFMLGLMASGYFIPFLMGTQLVCGVMLLSGAFIPLAIVVLAPIVINIILFHVFISPHGIPLAIIVGILEGYLAFFAEPYNKIVLQIFRCPMREKMLKKNSR
jgi:putative oxidoreductase